MDLSDIFQMQVLITKNLYDNLAKIDQEYTSACDALKKKYNPDSEEYKIENQKLFVEYQNKLADFNKDLNNSNQEPRNKRDRMSRQKFYDEADKQNQQGTSPGSF